MLITEMKNKPKRMLRMTWAKLHGEEHAGVLAAHFLRVALDAGVSAVHIGFETGHDRVTGQTLLRGKFLELRDTDQAKALAQQLVDVARMRGVPGEHCKVEIRDKPKTAIIKPEILYMRPRAKLETIGG